MGLGNTELVALIDWNGMESKRRLVLESLPELVYQVVMTVLDMTVAIKCLAFCQREHLED